MLLQVHFDADFWQAQASLFRLLVNLWICTTNPKRIMIELCGVWA